MYQIIDRAAMPDGTKIQLEDWHNNNSKEYQNLYGERIKLIKKRINDYLNNSNKESDACKKKAGLN